MVEAERRLIRVRQVTPVVQNLVQHSEGADQIGLDERPRTIDGAVHVALRRKVGHDLGLELA